ncbi:hypothetical protein C7H19_24435 [Aphanothece hegewaldii CCALA 016]|uniref:Uncharacterized protein n=1 Tax=Aphanothece hegewaldii CCALA 016 TaxID=2107694 RepID=A0A2T1LQU2_9CHRO|nr:hypothetical protein [Aphanothece hegewaldii]PSF29174.1 hypothetical protein C7H19_24435 [Aphanothece hegewaldii CCALA 016]
MARIDLRIDDELLLKIQEIAKERFKAKVHHISKNPEITPTLIKLIEYGIEHLESGLDTDSNRGSLPDSYLDQISEIVLQKITPKLPVSNPDNLDEIKSQLAEFDKAFQGLGSTVHDHVQMLSQPVASKEDLETAIASLQIEIEGVKKQ